MNSKAENPKSATVKFLNDLAVLHGNMLIIISKQKKWHFLKNVFLSFFGTAFYHILTVDSVVDLFLKAWSEENFIQKVNYNFLSYFFA